MEPEGSLSHSEEPTACLHPETDQSRVAVPKVCSADRKGSSTSCQGFRGYISLMARLFVCLFLAHQLPSKAMTSSFTRFLDHTHSDASQSIGLLWTSDQLVPENSTWQHTTLTTDIHAPGGIRTHNLSSRAAADLRFTPRVHWGRHFDGYFEVYLLFLIKGILFC